MLEWRVTQQPVDYPEAVAQMEARVAAIRDSGADELIWMLEHPPLYTAGTSAKIEDLIEPERFPVHQSKRGGQYTYHGPGQRVIYVMLDLDKRGRDIRKLVKSLENWVISTLAEFGIQGEIRDGRVGVWVKRPEKPLLTDGSFREDKVAAIGLRLRKWVSFHGISINIDPDLSHFAGIVPCGISGHGVTSLVDLGVPASMTDVDIALKTTFSSAFD